MLEKSRKDEVRERGFRKNMKFGRILDAKMGGVGRAKSCFYLGSLKNKISVIPKIREKWMPKWQQKFVKIGALGA